MYTLHVNVRLYTLTDTEGGSARSARRPPRGGGSIGNGASQARGAFHHAAAGPGRKSGSEYLVRSAASERCAVRPSPANADQARAAADDNSSVTQPVALMIQVEAFAAWRHVQGARQ